MNSSTSQWGFHHWAGNASDFHQKDLEPGRAVWWCDVDAPALILGSTQSPNDVDETAAASIGLDVVRRRSGGGAVYVHPTDSVWIDVTIGKDDALWVDDVTQSMLWLGDAFVRALSPWVDARVHRDAFDAGADGRAVCFASTAPGEVFVGTQKLVGISQRRGRDGARMQCVLYRDWKPAAWTSVVSSPTARTTATELSVATIDVDPADIVAAFVAALPR
jgi:lipoate-protein ligase A